MLEIKDKIIYFNNKPIILQGAALPENRWLTEKESQNPLKVIKKIKEHGFNCVRITIVPGHYQVYPNYLKTDIKPLVNEAKKQNLICILDWHALGNPLTNQTKLKEYTHENIYWYDASFDIAKKAWKEIIELFHKEEHILYELFNEPAPGEKDIPQIDLLALPWNTWKIMQQEIITIIRDKTLTPIIVSSNYWTFNLKETAKSPYDDEQIIYAFHCYPIRQNENWKDMLESIKNKPIIITEWGFDTKDESFYKGTIDDYARPLIDYCEKNNIHWIAWCFSASWSPRMLNKDWKTLSEFGQFAVKRLH